MTIVHVMASFIGGGAERFVVSLCNQLSKNEDLDVHIISLYDIKPNMFLHKEVNSNVTIHTLSKKVGLDTSIFFKLNTCIKTIKPNRVNTHLTAFNYNYLNILLYRKAKYYHTLHSDALLECPSAKNRSLRKLFYKKRVQAITISELSSQSYRTHYGLNNDCIIYNGREDLKATKAFNAVKHEVESYKLTPETKVILNIANLVPAKGHINLVKAFKALTDAGCDILLILIGDRRPGDDEIFNCIKDNLSPRLKFLGVKQNIEDYLLVSDAFCLSSNIEGMPITLIEAMSAACLPLATPVGGIPNMITDTENGLLAKDASQNALTALIKRYLALDGPKIKSIKQQLKNDYKQNFSIQKSTNGYLKLYSKA